VITLTASLLFVVLLYVYPLKFLWSLFFMQFVDARRAAAMLPRDAAWILFAIYGVGVAAAFTVLSAMYGHAYGRRRELELTPLETVDTRIEIYRNLALAGIAVLSVAIAMLSRVFAPRLVGLAGYVYFLIGVSEWTIGAYGGRMRRKLRAPAGEPIG
jgi:predicted outer membrane lipoprotein